MKNRLWRKSKRSGWKPWKRFVSKGTTLNTVQMLMLN